VEAAAKAEADAAEAAKGEDYDGDGVAEGENEGTRPEALEAARDGGADDLKRIKGVGPKMEQVCNGLGFYHFDQIAAWSEDEVAWVNANLKGFKGRVTRDDWVEQAKLLAAGGETEFSKKVDKGGVY
jgi:predicted flap endonuclease-1-like 5' DNA nuclease